MAVALTFLGRGNATWPCTISGGSFHCPNPTNPFGYDNCAAATEMNPAVVFIRMANLPTGLTWEFGDPPTPTIGDLSPIYLTITINLTVNTLYGGSNGCVTTGNVRCGPLVEPVGALTYTFEAPSVRRAVFDDGLSNRFELNPALPIPTDETTADINLRSRLWRWSNISDALLTVGHTGFLGYLDAEYTVAWVAYATTETPFIPGGHIPAGDATSTAVRRGVVPRPAWTT